MFELYDFFLSSYNVWFTRYLIFIKKHLKCQFNDIIRELGMSKTYRRDNNISLEFNICTFVLSKMK